MSVFSQSETSFQLLETTINDIQNAYQSGELTAHRLVQMYLDRIEIYDQNGPSLNSIINLNPGALEEADRLDNILKVSGLMGPLHGIPIIVKDQADVKDMPTTLGSVLFKDYYPDRDSFVVEKLKKAGAIIIAKSTLGELGGGDTHGSLFGSTRNPYALDRTVGGSSGGSAAGVAANFATVAVGQEGLASIRRPATWNCITGMRPTAGLVSRSGVYSGWPEIAGSLGPMGRTVKDVTILLDAMVGYDPEDPLTSKSIGQFPNSYTQFLDIKGLHGARIGVLREPMGINSKPDSEDFNQVSEVFDKSIVELKSAGAALVDPVIIPNLKELLAKRAGSPYGAAEAFKQYISRSTNPPFRTLEEMIETPDFSKVFQNSQNRLRNSSDETKHYLYLIARDELMTNLLKVMADNRLDAIVHKAVEHQPTLISKGVNPPYLNYSGAPHLNTFVVFVPSIVVPAGFTRDNLPTGITFLGRPYQDGNIIKLAYSYEQATHHRRPPTRTVANID